MERAVKVLERMENQNTYKELAMDFKVISNCAKLYAHIQSASKNYICTTLVSRLTQFVVLA